mgnify:CR=1 FL=1
MNTTETAKPLGLGSTEGLGPCIRSEEKYARRFVHAPT